jgi:hypothetical protein
VITHPTHGTFKTIVMDVPQKQTKVFVLNVIFLNAYAVKTSLFLYLYLIQYLFKVAGILCVLLTIKDYTEKNNLRNHS